MFTVDDFLGTVDAGYIVDSDGCGTVKKYHSDKMLLEFLRNNDIPDYDENIEF